MKTIYRILLLAFVVFSLFSCSRHDSFITSHDEQSRDDDELVAYYPFNGNANDESGNGNNGTVYGAILTEDRFGNPNSAYYFDGVSDYVLINDSDFLDLSTNGTIAGWINIPDDFTPPWQGVGFINKMLHSTGYYSYDIMIGHSALFAGGIGDGTNGQYLYTSYNDSENFYDNYWHFIAFSWDESQLKLYFDDIVIDSVSNPTSGAQITTWDVNIGRRAYASPTNWQYYKGCIDDIRIFNTTLTDNEVMELYHENGWIEGSLNINPSNSPENRFEMITPTGLIDISILNSEGSNFTYVGPASDINIKVKGQGKTLIINGTEYELSTDYRYTFTGNFEVYVYNAKANKEGNANGHWWIDIEGIAESIYPEIE